MINSSKLIALSLIFIFAFSTATFALGVTSPVPKAMKLLRGESANFEFEIQAVTSTDDLICTYSLADMSPLTVSFASNEVTVRAGTIQKVYGTISVPSNAPFKTYSAELTVSCGAVAPSGGGSEVRTTIGGTMLSLDVVEFREEAKKTAEMPTQVPATELILLIILIIIILGAYYLYKKKSKAKKRRK